MSLPTNGLAHRAAKGALAALLLSSVSTAALAAPKHRTHAAKPDPRDAKLQVLEQEVSEMRSEMAQMRVERAAAADAGQVAALQQQVTAANQQLAEVKTAQAASDANIIALQAPPSGATTIPSLPNGKPAFATADGRFSANLRAIIMFDAGKYFQKDNLGQLVVGRDLNEGTNFRRARFGIDGKLFKDFDYAIIYEFGGSGGEDAGHIQEIWAQYSALKPWKIRLGAFEPNIGLAAAVSTSQMPILERPSPAEVARNVAAGDSRSALQVFGNGVWGQGDAGVAARWFASAALTGNTVGTINSTGGATAQPFDEQTAIIGRFAIAPFDTTNWQLHFGVNGQYVFHANDSTGPAGGLSPRYVVQLRDRPELRLDATRLVDTGAIDTRHVTVLGAEVGATVQNLMLEGEYFDYRIDRRNATNPLIAPADPHFSGWYVQGAWVLTGEPRPYNPAEARFDAPKMAYNFNPAAGTWGTVELVARYSDLDLNFHECGAGRPTATTAGVFCFDAVRGGEQKISTIGMNWYLNPVIRFMLDYQHVDVDRFNAAGVQIGQKYNAVALRSQLSF
ncbi:MAG: OprO/OprP family phosphate-selective porin [Phenylobacterium sp.]